MQLNLLPTKEQSDLGEWMVFADYDEETNCVHWSACDSTNPVSNDILGTERGQFIVYRRGDAVCVEGCGWYSNDFLFRLELTERPERVVILAFHAAAMMDRAWDDESPDVK